MNAMGFNPVVIGVVEGISHVLPLFVDTVLRGGHI